MMGGKCSDAHDEVAIERSETMKNYIVKELSLDLKVTRRVI